MESIAYFFGALFSIFAEIYHVYSTSYALLVINDHPGMAVALFLTFIAMLALMLLGVVGVCVVFFGKKKI
ncbi:TPA: hypothetical protein N2N45_004278 [Klebsiella aerogenes]|nr:hypothetical protein [Klebsiella aerogenes]